MYLIVLLCTVDFQRGIHEGNVQRLAQWPFLLLALRRLSHRAAVRAARRPSLLHQVLRRGVRQHVQRVQSNHRHRLEGGCKMCCCYLPLTRLVDPLLRIERQLILIFSICCRIQNLFEAERHKYSLMYSKL